MGGLPLVSLSVLLSGVLGAACTSPTEPPVDVEAADGTGVTVEDVLVGIERREDAVEACMAEAGYEYTRTNPEDQVIDDGDRPGWGMAASLLDAVRGEDSLGPSASAGPENLVLGYSDKVVECRLAALEEHEQRLAQVRPLFDRFDRAWGEFKSSDQYAPAAEEWSSCMAEEGYEIAHPDQVRDDLVHEQEALISGHLESGTFEDIDEQVVLDLLDREVALRDADTRCRAETVDSVELEFRTKLFTEEADAVVQLRRAHRGD